MWVGVAPKTYSEQSQVKPQLLFQSMAFSGTHIEIGRLLHNGTFMSVTDNFPTDVGGGGVGG